MRTTVLRLHPGMRVLARTWIGDDAVLGPGSQGHGSAVFDVIVAAGTAPAEVSVARLPQESLPKLIESFPHSGLGNLFREWLNPSGRVDEAGLIHHLRRPAYLAWSVHDGGSTSAGFGEPSVWTSVAEYSYSIDQEFKDNGGMSSSHSYTIVKSFNGRGW